MVLFLKTFFSLCSWNSLGWTWESQIPCLTTIQPNQNTKMVCPWHGLLKKATHVILNVPLTIKTLLGSLPGRVIHSRGCHYKQYVLSHKSISVAQILPLELQIYTFTWSSLLGFSTGTNSTSSKPNHLSALQNYSSFMFSVPLTSIFIFFLISPFFLIPHIWTILKPCQSHVSQLCAVFPIS